jgi:hypothetical protein
MQCSHCDTKTANVAFEETSHLGKRPICYVCLGRRDEARMKNGSSIILYYKNNELVNYTHTLHFEIVGSEKSQQSQTFYFIYNKKKWKGMMYPHCNHVNCRKL